MLLKGLRIASRLHSESPHMSLFSVFRLPIGLFVSMAVTWGRCKPRA